MGIGRLPLRFSFNDYDFLNARRRTSGTGRRRPGGLGAGARFIEAQFDEPSSVAELAVDEATDVALPRDEAFGLKPSQGATDLVDRQAGASDELGVRGPADASATATIEEAELVEHEQGIGRQAKHGEVVGQGPKDGGDVGAVHGRTSAVVGMRAALPLAGRPGRGRRRVGRRGVVE